MLYLYGEPDGKRIKVGKTQNIETRMAQHSKRGPDNVDLTVFAVWWGLPNDEQFLKEHWAPLLCDGDEWFLANRTLKSWIRELRKKPFVVRKANNKAMGRMPFAHPDHWRPQINGCERQTALPLEVPTGGQLWGDIVIEQDEEGEGDFYSPKTLVERARLVFGGCIDLDPASCREADKTIQALKYYSRHEDGLRQPWYGRVWLNPPFSQWELWSAKLIAELPHVDQAIVLNSVRATTTRSFHPIVRSSDAMLKIRGRDGFSGPRANVSPDGGHELYYFGNNVVEFNRQFKDMGIVFVPYESRANRSEIFSIP